MVTTYHLPPGSGSSAAAPRDALVKTSRALVSMTNAKILKEDMSSLAYSADE